MKPKGLRSACRIWGLIDYLTGDFCCFIFVKNGGESIDMSLI